MRSKVSLYLCRWVRSKVCETKSTVSEWDLLANTWISIDYLNQLSDYLWTTSSSNSYEQRIRVVVSNNSLRQWSIGISRVVVCSFVALGDAPSLETLQVRWQTATLSSMTTTPCSAMPTPSPTSTAAPSTASLWPLQSTSTAWTSSTATLHSCRLFHVRFRQHEGFRWLQRGRNGTKAFMTQ